MFTKKWVKAKQNLVLPFSDKVIVPAGEVGFVKVNAKIKEENGAILFPQTVFNFKDEVLEDALLPNNNQSYLTLKDFYASNDITRGKGWFKFHFHISEKIIPQHIIDSMGIIKATRKFRKVLKMAIEDMVNENHDDAALQADFPWIVNWKVKDNYILIQHKDKKTPEEFLNSYQGIAIDLAMDIKLINKKIRKSEKQLIDFFQTREPWEEEL